MGRCVESLVLVGAAVALLMAFSLNSPVPDGFSEPWKLRAFLAPKRIMMDFIAPVVRYFYGVREEMAVLNKFFAMKGKATDGHHESNIEIRDLVFDGVPVRMYRPVKGDDSRVPGIVFIHGGGWVLGNLDMYQDSCLWLSSNSSMTVVSVNYRMAPDHLFPVPFQDCEKATVYFIKHAHEYGVDAQKIAVMGDSAGGNLAAAVTLRLRDTQMKPALKAQILIYPCLQTINFLTPSYKLNDPLLSKDLMVDFWLLYALGDVTYAEALKWNNHTTQAVRSKYGAYVNPRDLPDYISKDLQDPDFSGDGVELWGKLEKIFLNPYFAPGIASDLKGLPQTYIMTAGVDPLRDEGILYAQRMTQDGNDVSHSHFKTLFHGIYGKTLFSDGIAVNTDILGFVMRSLAD